MIDQSIGNYVFITLTLITFFSFSILIPIYGYFHKRWKGLAIGCIVQPLICVILFFLTIGGIFIYQRHTLNKHRKDAMVKVRKIDAEGDTLIWYVKPNEECCFECREKNDDNAVLSPKNMKLFDVVPLDSFAVCIDDKIVVKFDMENRKATATEYDKPIEVISIDWDKVSAFYQKQE